MGRYNANDLSPLPQRTRAVSPRIKMMMYIHYRYTYIICGRDSFIIRRAQTEQHVYKYNNDRRMFKRHTHTHTYTNHYDPLYNSICFNTVGRMINNKTFKRLRKITCLFEYRLIKICVLGPVCTCATPHDLFEIT